MDAVVEEEQVEDEVEEQELLVEEEQVEARGKINLDEKLF